MPKCSICFASHLSVNGLYHHLSIHHPSRLSGVLKCMEENCFGLKRDWRSLRRHLIRDHKVPIHALSLVRNSGSTPAAEEDNTQSVSNTHDSSDSDECLNNDSDFGNFAPLEDLVLERASSLFCSFYANPSLPRSIVQSLTIGINNILQVVTSSLSPLLTELLENEDKVVAKSRIESLLQAIVHPFEDTLSTEYKRFKYLRMSGNFFEAVDYVVGDRLDDVYRGGVIVQERVSVKGKYVPIDVTLSKFLSQPNVLETVKSYVSDLEDEYKSGIMSNFMQGKLWQEMLKNFQGKFALPLFVYFDDFEVNDPLSPHAGIHKLGAVYYSLPFLPPEYRSTLDHIFLALLFHASDRAVVEDGNYRVFNDFIQSLNSLQTNGVLVEVNGQVEKIFFVASLLLADNLGFNSALGFAGGFNANYYCRFCKVRKDSMKCDGKERKEFLRKVSEYEDDVENGLSLTGMVESSVWNSLQNFHVYRNYSVDPAHDFAEGICKTDMSIILRHYIIKEKRLTVSSLNARLSSFNYTINGLKNKPSLLCLDDVKSGGLPSTATEMLTLTLLFGVIVGDIIQPDVENDPVWQLYVTLREMLDIVFAKSIPVESIQHFADLVERHNRIRVEVLKVPLKPKDHFPLHYHRIMQMSGPVSHLSVMRFESKHRILKTNARSTTSRVNITHTLCLKEQLSLCYRLSCQSGLDDKFESGPEELFSVLSDMTDYYLFASSLPADFKEECLVVRWVKFKGVHYRCGSFVAVDIDTETFPVFACISHIILNVNSDICFVCKLFETNSFDETMHAYFISETSLLKCYKLEDLLYPFLVLYHKQPSDRHTITLKQLL